MFFVHNVFKIITAKINFVTDLKISDLTYNFDPFWSFQKSKQFFLTRRQIF
jgi:hypothetical protein